VIACRTTNIDNVEHGLKDTTRVTFHAMVDRFIIREKFEPINGIVALKACAEDVGKEFILKLEAAVALCKKAVVAKVFQKPSKEETRCCGEIKYHPVVCCYSLPCEFLTSVVFQKLLLSHSIYSSLCKPLLRIHKRLYQSRTCQTSMASRLPYADIRTADEKTNWSNQTYIQRSSGWPVKITNDHKVQHVKQCLWYFVPPLSSCFLVAFFFFVLIYGLCLSRLLRRLCLETFPPASCLLHVLLLLPPLLNSLDRAFVAHRQPQHRRLPLSPPSPLRAHIRPLGFRICSPVHPLHLLPSVPSPDEITPSGSSTRARSHRPNWKARS